MTPRPRRTPWLRLLVLCALLAFSATTVWRSVLPARAALSGTRAMVTEQEAENERLERTIDARTREADALRTDPQVVERALREELHITDENEVIVR